jgi:hypothetical protein
LAIVPALVCLTVVSLLCAALLKQARLQRQSVRTESRRLQAEWLAESGAARAAARLAADEGYRGEDWRVDAGALGGPAAGVVRIAVEPEDGRPRGRRVRVEADYPEDESERSRVSKSLTINLGPRPSGGDS